MFVVLGDIRKCSSMGFKGRTWQSHVLPLKPLWAEQSIAFNAMQIFRPSWMSDKLNKLLLHPINSFSFFKYSTLLINLFWDVQNRPQCKFPFFLSIK